MAALQGGFSFLSFQSQRLSQLIYQPLNTPAFIQHGTKLHLESERGQARQEIFQLVLKILLNEEIGVVESGGDHLLVAIGNGIQELVIAIAHTYEVWQKATIRFTDGEIALVFFHYRDQHFRRQA